MEKLKSSDTTTTTSESENTTGRKLHTQKDSLENFNYSFFPAVLKPPMESKARKPDTWSHPQAKQESPLPLKGPFPLLPMTVKHTLLTTLPMKTVSNLRELISQLHKLLQLEPC